MKIETIICDRCGKEIKGMTQEIAMRSEFRGKIPKCKIQIEEAERFGYLDKVDLGDMNVQDVKAVFSYCKRVKGYELCKECGIALKKFLKNE